MPKKMNKTPKQLADENVELRLRLEEAEETLRAILSGEVDALVRSGPQGEQIFTLKGAEYPYRALIDNMGEGALTITTEGTILYANRRFAGMVKTPLEKIIGSNINHWFAPDSQWAIREVLQKSGEQKRVDNLNLAVGDGSQIDILLSVTPLLIEELPDSLSIVVTDITERKRAEVAVLQSEAKFRNIFENSPLGKSLTGMDGSLNVNKAFCDIVGYSTDELCAKDWKEITHPDDIQESLNVIQSLIDGKRRRAQYEKRYIHKDGHIVWVEITTALERDKNSEPLYFLTTINDITGRKQMETALIESQTLYRLLAEHSSDVVTLIDSVGKVKYASPSTYYRLGYTESDLLGLDTPGILMHVHPDDRERIGLEIKRGRQLKLPTSRYEYRLQNKQGNYIWVEDILQREFDEHGEFVQTIVNSREITERKQAEAEIKKMNAELEQRVAQRTAQLEIANKELQSFAYSVSHDLRAPLRAIDGFSQTLWNKYSGQLGQEGEHYLTRVHENTKRMGQLIDDLLVLSRISRQEMSHQPVDLMMMAKEITAEFAESEPERNVRFQIAEQAVVEGDAGLLKVVLQNLLGNAWKFTSKRDMAEIEVGFKENDNERVFFVRDNGVGFDMQYADKLFGAFQRLHSTHEFPGTGIGLATVQRVIHRHGGRIWAEAAVDQGATFYFTLGETS